MTRGWCCADTAPPELDPFSEEGDRAGNPAFGDFYEREEVLAMAADATPHAEPAGRVREPRAQPRVEASSPFIARPVWKRAAAGHRELQGPAGLRRPWTCRRSNDLTALGADRSGRRVVARQADVLAAGRGPAGEALAAGSRALRRVGQGRLLATTPGKTIEYEYVAGAAPRALFDELDVRKIAFDRWNSGT
jgi:hypothetical protein